jgi:hypothetical protein
MTASIAEGDLAEYNQPQKQAIWAACEGKRCFTLIQGPPGTGKTRTIMGILKRLVTQQHHILVCAPSNAAVDELLSRMIEHGLDVSHGTSPPLVRIGKRDVVSQRVQVTLLRPRSHIFELLHCRALPCAVLNASHCAAALHTMAQNDVAC